MPTNNQWSEEVALLSAILDKTPLEKTTKWGSDVYTSNGKNVVSCGGFKNFFTLWFYNGVFLEDPYKVLISASEGQTKSLRQWRFTSKEEIDEKKILSYVNEAIEIEKKGLKIKPAKFSTVPPPGILSTALKNDKAFNLAFEKLTPGKQKEYILFINEAKQEATKMRRLEKIIPMILQGMELHGKYK
jgi:uncharacterized protein YdeI (YjbR/CyaY-like superfamily)